MTFSGFKETSVPTYVTRTKKWDMKVCVDRLDTK